jgi:hydrogenase nickel incorporation protein HypB
MFSICDVLLINKIDTIGVFDFDVEAVIARAKALNPDITVIPMSARTGEGVADWVGWLESNVAEWKNNQGVQ